MAEIVDRFTEVVGFDRYARLRLRLRRADRPPPCREASRPDHCDHLAERQRLRGGAERRLEPDPGLLARPVAGQPRGAAAPSSRRRRRSGNTPTACPTRRRSRRTDTRWTTSIWLGLALTSCSSTCSATTRATSRSTRPSRRTSAPTSRRFSQCGARTIRFSCRRAPRHSSATSGTPSSASSTPATSRWRPTPRRSRATIRRIPVSRLMSKSVAIVTGASQGIGQATAIRLARDFSALVLVARDRPNLEQTAELVRRAGAEALIVDDRPDPACSRTGRRRPDPGSVRSDRRSAQHRGRRSSDRPVRDDRCAVGRGLALKLHGARRLTIAAWPALQEQPGRGGAHVRKFGVVPQGALRSRRCDQRRDRWPRQGASPIVASPMAFRSTASCPGR